MRERLGGWVGGWVGGLGGVGGGKEGDWKEREGMERENWARISLVEGAMLWSGS